MKKRGGFHEDTIRELSITKDGIKVGKALKNFQGVLTGVPSFHGSMDALLGPERDPLA